MAKPRIKIKEIKKNIKITEIKKEEVIEKKPQEEESLEELALDAPSARAFPQFNQPEIRVQEIQAPAEREEKKEENTNQPAYAVRNVTEGELQRTYETRATTAQRSIIRNPVLAQRERPASELQNPEIQALKSREQDGGQERYEVKIEESEQRRRKLPWEI